MANIKVDAVEISYPAVPIVQNNQRFFFATIPVSKLFPYCFVSRRNEDAKTGFQRRLNESRAEDIAKYLNDGLGSIPTNIVLSAQPDSEVSYNSRSKTLKYPGNQTSFLVLDGQHRLFGYQICHEKYNNELRVPVSIYVGLTRVEEARLFIDINTTQVGVPSALLLDIKQVAEIESTSEQLLRGIFDQLNSDKFSPLKGLLSPARSIAGKVSRVTFNKSVLLVIRSNVWANTSKKSQYQLLLNYVRAADSVINDRAILTKSAFFESLFEVFDDVVQTSITKSGDAKEESIKQVLLPLAAVDFNGILMKGKATKSSYLEPIRNALKKSISISDAMV